jgi:hypothetical protein
MERNLKLTIKQAQKLYKEQPEMRELLLTTFTKEELEGVVLKDWSELGYIKGYRITSDSIIIDSTELSSVEIMHRNIFATEKQAKSALAMAQLSQLMKDLGDECDVNWTNDSKYVIKRYENSLRTECYLNTYHFLAFRTIELCKAFMAKHERLIKDYFMLD